MHVLVVCGGQSPEHKISFISAKNIISHMKGFEVTVAVIALDGVWTYLPDPKRLNDLESLTQGHQIGVPASLVKKADGVCIASDGFEKKVDVVFPVCHGPLGEDGTLQGMLEILGVPYVGTDYQSAMLAMDKDLFKRLMQHAGLPVVPGIMLKVGDACSWQEACDRLQSNYLFIKPSHMGSSVGVSRVTTQAEFDNALGVAFRYGNKLIIEPQFDGLELECAVRGHNHLYASEVGQIVTATDWYDYESKYENSDAASTLIPANIPQNITKEVQHLSIEACRVIGCDVMARVDFFYSPTDGLVVNEINTIPGFTAISLYPQLWSYSGVPTDVLISDMIMGSLGVSNCFTES